MTRIAYIGTYVPQKCGIATYTHHLRQSISQAKGWKGKDPVFAIKPGGSLIAYNDPDVYEVPKDKRAAYKKLAERLNGSDIGVVSLQHEFGIFGGEAGSYVLDLVENLDKPLAVTFHTVFEKPEEPYFSIQERIARRSDLILVMNRKAKEYLNRSFGIPLGKIQYVPHGTPSPLPGRREAYRKAMGWDGHKILMTFGLLGRGKGLETIIKSLPDVVREVPETLYTIVGQTHPEVRKAEGESYREELKTLVRDLGLENNVAMIDRYVEEDELAGLLSACDLYVTPYPGLQQITSGTLAYAVGLGRPVLSTPYAYAKDLLSDYPELLIQPGDIPSWSEGMRRILADEDNLRQTERCMAALGAPMNWPSVGRLHLDMFSSLAAPLLRAN
ncbi:GDP-mannose-dependent alpha-(1-6)-phosphatidylinositol monomannoside mannosyltransferase [compost metagenome]